MKILISGGGTGGHIFPALAIANAIRRRDPEAEILFVGAEGRMEMERVPAAGYNIVGLPVAKLLLDENATVTIAHSRTVDLPTVTRNAEILVVAIGRPKFVTADMVSEGAVVIDVGVNRDPETGKLCGDVDYAAIEPKASVITPVPGGVGPMTITCLMENTIECLLRKM